MNNKKNNCLSCQFIPATIIPPGIFLGGELEPGTFHGGELEPGTFHGSAITPGAFLSLDYTHTSHPVDTLEGEQGACLLTPDPEDGNVQDDNLTSCPPPPNFGLVH